MFIRVSLYISLVPFKGYDVCDYPSSEAMPAHPFPSVLPLIMCHTVNISIIRQLVLLALSKEITRSHLHLFLDWKHCIEF